MSEIECPKYEDHTPSPHGYLEWHEWARQMMAQRSRQARCSGCGLWAVWYGMKPPIPVDAIPSGCLYAPRPKRWGKAS